ncbi:rhodanese-like domain-containing protein, partial [Robiginitalea biformata]|uniref:rhodanese-like domain-containing protein n=1 Tax=Robiginitalea biformata TaxID=252307 RepID=UPI003D354AD5
DVRTAEEMEEGYIPGPIQIDIYSGQGFLDEVEKLDKCKSYYVYCRSGNRSGQRCSLMQSKGFERTYNLVGGMLEWD